MLSKRVLVSSLALSVAFACAEAQDDSPNSSNSNTDEGGKSSGGQGGVAGKLTSAGTTSVSQGATSSSGGVGTSGAGGKGGGGGKGGTGGVSGSATGGNATGGRAGSGSGGASGSSSAGSSNAGTSAGGTNTAGTGSTGLACVEEVVPDPSAGGADAGGAGPVGEAGATAAGAKGGGGAPNALDLFFDDFEGDSTKWTTTLGTWALVDDGSKAYEQSLQENKLQIAVANGVCLANQIIDAKIKVVGFKGQSNSYMAALFGRVLSPTTHYLLALGSDGKLALRKRINSTSTGATAIGSAVTTAIAAGQWYDVHFEIIGANLKGCIGAVCVTGTDSSIASGSVGVGTVNTSARFDDVRLTTP